MGESREGVGYGRRVKRRLLGKKGIEPGLSWGAIRGVSCKGLGIGLWGYLGKGV